MYLELIIILYIRIILRLFFMYINNNLRKFIGGRLIYEKG
ncbi:hypothetical protein B0I63_000733 [Clostridium beijerinckii]|jgi:hypothetical protein|uniref:Uncharacterized protein n=1 Tax=Clostridium beijerinckii TaxID=1520 RepID=A0A1S8PYG4_CLOBE|nr:hypothetical protein CLBIJ_05980 [Clostridium beijerinckii]MBA2886646.1 hypothetical protein [Clostridium beijerinckii]MBA2901265.1 hypothetical protein [Clostridium beijerinckii]MBA2911206.1 hypothetical protein [Clostridium beijerinckii]MBA9017274.1 hypothetical protein [Clostridium beijerinckii]